MVHEREEKTFKKKKKKEREAKRIFPQREKKGSRAEGSIGGRKSLGGEVVGRPTTSGYLDCLPLTR